MRLTSCSLKADRLSLFSPEAAVWRFADGRGEDEPDLRPEVELASRLRSWRAAARDALPALDDLRVLDDLRALDDLREPEELRALDDFWERSDELEGLMRVGSGGARCANSSERNPCVGLVPRTCFTRKGVSASWPHFRMTGPPLGPAWRS